MTLVRLTLFSVILALAAPALAQQSPQNAGDPSTAASTACSFSYFSGPLATFTRYCLGANGNIVQFDSPSGFEYINNGNLMEGYGFCDFNANVSYYDYGSSDSGNWGPTTITTPNATTKVFVRQTADGTWQLTQTITQIKATASSTGSVKITMAVKNLSNIARNNNTLLRVANVNNGPDPLNDEFVSSLNSAFGQEPGRWGLSLVTNTFTVANNGIVLNVPAGPDPCHYVTHVNPFAFVGDGSIGHVYNLSVPAHASKIVTMSYKPI